MYFFLSVHPEGNASGRNDGASAMIIMAKEKRPNRVTFLLTDEEMEIVSKRMEMLGITSMSAYIRKMILNGFILTLNMPELKEMISLQRYTSNNINQIAKRLNETDRIYTDDMEEIKSNQKKLWNGINRILSKLTKVS